MDLSPTNRPSRVLIQKKSGRDDSDPPRNGGSIPAPCSGTVGHAPTPAPGGRYRRYLSLREGSEQDASRTGADQAENGPMKLQKTYRKLTTALEPVLAPGGRADELEKSLSAWWPISAGKFSTAWLFWWVNGSGTASGPVRLCWQFPPPGSSFSGGCGSPFGALSGVPFRRLRRSLCSIFWSITTRILIVPLWSSGTTFRRWWR